MSAFACGQDEPLGEQLSRQDIRGQSFIVGGAAMALARTRSRARPLPNVKGIEVTTASPPGIYSR
jgi:hypothetical protein